MSRLQIDSETGTVDFTTIKTVLTYLSPFSRDVELSAVVDVGSAVAGLDGTGGNFQLTLTVGGQVIQPGPQTITYGTGTRTRVESAKFVLRVGETLTVGFLSPNAADTAVAYTSYLYLNGDSNDIFGQVDTVVNTHTPTQYEFQSDSFTETTTDHFRGREVVFISGTLAEQRRIVIDYRVVGGIGQFGTNGTTEAPVDNDFFIIG